MKLAEWGFQDIAYDECEELRLAVVMNGGVSLAVWIGGVANEINRLTRRQGCYRELLDFLATEVRVDVISGTSAGGLNGALLAVAQVYDSDLKGLRDIWLEKSAFQTLLRDPLSKDLPSLFDGDGFFLNELKEALESLITREQYRGTATRPVDLTITTTLMKGYPFYMTDDLGNVVVDSDYRARFRFQRGPDVVGEDPFADPETLVRKLSSAARATAAFPVAFEPAYYPPRKKKDEENSKPGNAGNEEFVTATGTPIASGQYLLDGGILDNKPIESALEAIFAQRADRNVRRVLAYVVPDPGEPDPEDADDEGGSPTVGEVAVASLINIPRHETISDQLRQISDHNLAVERQRQARIRLIATLETKQIEELAKTLFPVYQRHRREGAIRYIVNEVDQGIRNAAQNRCGLGRHCRNFLAEILDRCDMSLWIPKTLPQSLQLKNQHSIDNWAWGLYPVEYFAQVMLDVLRQAQRLAPHIVGQPERKKIQELRRQAYDILADVIEFRSIGTQKWQRSSRELYAIFQEEGVSPKDIWDKVEKWAQKETTKREEDTYRFVKMKTIRPAKRKRPEKGIFTHQARGWLAHQIAAIIWEAAPIIREVVTAAEKTRHEKEKLSAKELRRFIDFLAPADAPNYKKVVQRLLTLDVVTYAVGGRPPATDQIVELVQISSNAPSAFKGPSTAKEKLAGVQLGHFGAFYKRSWRANDWMFGRLDGAMRLAQAVLNPDRLRRLYGKGAGILEDPAEYVLKNIIARLAFGSVADYETRRKLEGLWTSEIDAARKELAFLNETNTPVPDSLTVCAKALARRLQLEILVEELPALADAVKHDQRQGSDKRDNAGAKFLEAYESLQGKKHKEKSRLTAEEALVLFAKCKVGQEKILKEVGSDLFTNTFSKALAVTVSAGSSAKSGLGILRRLLALIRAPIILFYLMAQNLVRKTRTGAALNASLIAIGATVTGLYLFGTVSQSDMPGFLLPTGVTFLIAGIFLGVVRHPLICTAVLLGLAGGLLWLLDPEDILTNIKSVGKNLLPVGIFIAVIIALSVLRLPRWLDKTLIWRRHKK